MHDGVVEVPFTQIFPYDFGGAGDINSNIEALTEVLKVAEQQKVDRVVSLGDIPVTTEAVGGPTGESYSPTNTVIGKVSEIGIPTHPAVCCA